MASIGLSSDTTAALQEMSFVIPYNIPSSLDRFQEAMRQPLVLMSPSKKPISLPVPENLFSISFEQSGERPVAKVSWNYDGWDRLSYLYLTDMAKQVKDNPKSIPRSMRMFANLMNKLPETPTGNGAVDVSRRIVIERNIEQIAPAIRDEVERRIKSWAQ